MYYSLHCTRTTRVCGLVVGWLVRPLQCCCCCAELNADCCCWMDGCSFPFSTDTTALHVVSYLYMAMQQSRRQPLVARSINRRTNRQTDRFIAHCTTIARKLHPGSPSSVCCCACIHHTNHTQHTARLADSHPPTRAARCDHAFLRTGHTRTGHTRRSPLWSHAYWCRSVRQWQLEKHTSLQRTDDVLVTGKPVHRKSHEHSTLLPRLKSSDN